MSLRQQLTELYVNDQTGGSIRLDNEDIDQILTLFKERLPRKKYSENIDGAMHQGGYNQAIEEVTQLLEEGLRHEKA